LDSGENTKKVQVSVFYKSLCPGCMNYIVGSLRSAVVQEDWDKMLQIELVPFGLATTHYEELELKMDC